MVEEAEQCVALVAVHPDDLVHEPARHPQRTPAGDGVGAHERVLDRRELAGDAVGDLGIQHALDAVVEVRTRVVTHAQAVAQASA